MCSSLSVKIGTSASSVSQARAKVSVSAFCQRVCASLSIAIAIRSIGRSRLTRRSTWPSSHIRLGAGTCTRRVAGLRVDEQCGARIAGAIEDRGERHGVIPLASPDRENLRLRAGLWMDVERPALGDDEALSGERLDAEIVGARCDGAFDPGAQQVLEHAEERVLQIDRQRQQPVEEGRDRRQILA